MMSSSGKKNVITISTHRIYTFLTSLSLKMAVEEVGGRSQINVIIKFKKNFIRYSNILLKSKKEST